MRIVVELKICRDALVSYRADELLFFFMEAIDVDGPCPEVVTIFTIAGAFSPRSWFLPSAKYNRC